MFEPGCILPPWDIYTRFTESGTKTLKNETEKVDAINLLDYNPLAAISGGTPNSFSQEKA